MKRAPNRRTVLKIAGAVALAAAAAPVAASPTIIDGTVGFNDGKALPEGVLEIYLEDPAIDDAGLRRIVGTRLESNGKSKAIAFALSPAASPSASPMLRIVARLERGDGWLLARGSARFEAGPPIRVTLNAVIY